MMGKKGSGREMAMLVKGMRRQHCWGKGKRQEKPWSLSRAWCCNAGQERAAFVVHYKKLSDILFYLQGRKLSAKRGNISVGFLQCELLSGSHAPRVHQSVRSIHRVPVELVSRSCQLMEITRYYARPKNKNNIQTR